MKLKKLDVNDVCAWIVNEMTDSERSRVVAALKELRYSRRNQFSIGDFVQFVPKKRGYGSKVVIQVTSIGPVNLTGAQANGLRWRVSPFLVTKCEKPADWPQRLAPAPRRRRSDDWDA